MELFLRGNIDPPAVFLQVRRTGVLQPVCSVLN